MMKRESPGLFARPLCAALCGQVSWMCVAVYAGWCLDMIAVCSIGVREASCMHRLRSSGRDCMWQGSLACGGERVALGDLM